MKEINTTSDREDVRSKVRDGYARIAENKTSCCGPSSCCSGPAASDIARAIGYVSNELSEIPDGANMGLSCGNPIALASLQSGDIVLDLGSGGGFDVFIAARKVGESGRVIGVDMTPEMISKARLNNREFRQSTGLDNVEFRLGEIEHLPVADTSIDVVISNCVINLSPEKEQVWREIARVLKPGGRACISDLALLKPLPESVRQSLEALVGCIAGAVLIDETRAMIESAGLRIVKIETKSDYMKSMSDWSDPLYKEIALQLPSGHRPDDTVTSLSIIAVKSSKKTRQATVKRAIR